MRKRLIYPTKHICVDALERRHVAQLNLKRNEHAHAKTFFWDLWKSELGKRGFEYEKYANQFFDPAKDPCTLLNKYFTGSSSDYCRLIVYDGIIHIRVEAHCAHNKPDIFAYVEIPQEEREIVEAKFRKRLKRDLFAKTLEPEEAVLAID